MNTQYYTNILWRSPVSYQRDFENMDFTVFSMHLTFSFHHMTFFHWTACMDSLENPRMWWTSSVYKQMWIIHSALIHVTCPWRDLSVWSIHSCIKQTNKTKNVLFMFPKYGAVSLSSLLNVAYCGDERA